MPKPQHSSRMPPKDGSSAKVLPWCQARGFSTGTAQPSPVLPSVLGTIPQTAQAELREALATLPPVPQQHWLGMDLHSSCGHCHHQEWSSSPAVSPGQQSRACQSLADICLLGNTSPGDLVGICPGRKAHFIQRIRICFQVPNCTWSRPPSSTDVDLSYWQINLLSWEMLLVPGPTRRRALPTQGSYSQGQHCSKTSASPCM